MSWFSAPLPASRRSNASKFDPGFEAPKLEIPKLEVPKFEPKLMDMIDKFRAQKCVELFDEHGKLFPSFDACWEFMKALVPACVAGSSCCTAIFHSQRILSGIGPATA